MSKFIVVENGDFYGELIAIEDVPPKQRFRIKDALQCGEEWIDRSSQGPTYYPIFGYHMKYTPSWCKTIEKLNSPENINQRLFENYESHQSRFGDWQYENFSYGWIFEYNAQYGLVVGTFPLKRHYSHPIRQSYDSSVAYRVLLGEDGTTFYFDPTGKVVLPEEALDDVSNPGEGCDFEGKAHIKDESTLLKQFSELKKAQSNKKFRLRDNYTSTPQIVALKSFGEVYVGDMGGLVSGEHNLSHADLCWISPYATVKDDARVEDNAIIGADVKMYDRSVARGNARAKGKIHMRDDSLISDTAYLEGEINLFDDVKVGGSSRIESRGTIFISAGTLISGKAVVFSHLDEYVHIKHAHLTGESVVMHNFAASVTLADTHVVADNPIFNTALLIDGHTYTLTVSDNLAEIIFKNAKGYARTKRAPLDGVQSLSDIPQEVKDMLQYAAQLHKKNIQEKTIRFVEHLRQKTE